MVAKPYFNEPGYAEEEGTATGEERSRDYNENIRVATMKHAMRPFAARRALCSRAAARLT